MKNLSILFVFTTSLFGANANTIAVFPWMDMAYKNHISARSYEIERTINMELTTIPNTIPLERERMDKILKEQALIYAGLIDEKNGAKLGALLGAKYILWGSIEKIPEDKHSLRILGRLEEVETGKILRFIWMKIPKKHTLCIKYFSTLLSLQSGYTLSEPFRKEIDKITPYDISKTLLDTLSEKFDIQKGKERSDKALIEMLNNKAEIAISKGDFKEALRNLNASLSLMRDQPDVKLKIEAIKRTTANIGGKK